jgi:hypothetical protein
MVRDVMILMLATSITRAIGKGGGEAENETVVGHEMATSEASAIWAQKSRVKTRYQRIDEI